jgi:uncharacterized membrane protein YkvA (DUF1232 family)
MSQKRRLVSNLEGDFFTRFGLQIRLIIRLMGDRRISFWLKTLPVFSLIYLISPLDIVIPLVDDAFILWIANTLFLELCPNEIVEEHRAKLENETRRKNAKGEPIKEDDVIEVKYKDKP